MIPKELKDPGHVQTYLCWAREAGLCKRCERIKDKKYYYEESLKKYGSRREDLKALLDSR